MSMRSPAKDWTWTAIEKMTNLNRYSKKTKYMKTIVKIQISNKHSIQDNPKK